MKIIYNKHDPSHQWGIVMNDEEMAALVAIIPLLPNDNREELYTCLSRHNSWQSSWDRDNDGVVVQEKDKRKLTTVPELSDWWKDIEVEEIQ